MFCRSAKQRAFADELNLSLSRRTHFRIIDVAAEADFPAAPPRSEMFGQAPWQERSLLYALSCASAIVSLSSDAFDLRAESVLAALAALPLVALSAARIPAGLDQTLLLDVAHLIPVHEHKTVTVERAVLDSSGRVELGTYEQYIERTGVHELGRLLRAALVDNVLFR